MKTGEVLPNGAIVLVEGKNVVLAKNDCGTKDEYVTWKWDGKDPRSTYHGHYHESIAAAALDFEARQEGG